MATTRGGGGSAHRAHPAGKPEASFPIHAKSRTSSDVVKHAAHVFKHIGEGPRGESSPSAALYIISPPHGHLASTTVATPAPRSSDKVGPEDCVAEGGPSIVQQLLSLSQLKKDNCLTDREFALAKWQVLGLAHKLKDGAETHRDVHVANTFSPAGRAGGSSDGGGDTGRTSARANVKRRAAASTAATAAAAGKSPAAVPPPKDTISRLQQQHMDAMRSSPRPLYAHHYSKIFVSVPHARLKQRVTVVRQNGPPASGTVRFTGLTQFASGTWVGVDLDTPGGRNNGSVNGVTYFSCRAGHGLFVRPDAVYVQACERAVRASVQCVSACVWYCVAPSVGACM